MATATDVVKIVLCMDGPAKGTWLAVADDLPFQRVPLLAALGGPFAVPHADGGLDYRHREVYHGRQYAYSKTARPEDSRVLALILVPLWQHDPDDELRIVTAWFDRVLDAASAALARIVTADDRADSGRIAV